MWRKRSRPSGSASASSSRRVLRDEVKFRKRAKAGMVGVMSLEGNNLVGRFGQATIRDGTLIGLDRWIKRAIDILIATAGLIRFAPILLLASMAISLDSGRPIFIREAPRRCDNQAIRVLKFRLGCATGNRTNPLMTRVGQILNLTGIDELPQLAR